MPKYLFLFMSDDERFTDRSKEELERHYAAIGKWWDDASHAGKIQGGEELAHRRTATTVRFTDKGAVVTDGPYMEAKELIGGYALVDVPDLDAAIALAKGWPAQSTVEIRPLIENH